MCEKVVMSEIVRLVIVSATLAVNERLLLSASVRRKPKKAYERRVYRKNVG